MACVFCKIVKGELPSNIVYEDDINMVFLDIYPVSKGHLLVIPKEHFESLNDTPERILARTWLLASILGRIYRDYLEAPGVNIVTNSGRAAGQEVFHFHVHVIPRWGRWMGFWGGRHRLSDAEANEVLDMWRDKKELIIEGLSKL